MTSIPVSDSAYPWSSVVFLTAKWKNGAVTNGSGVVVDLADQSYVLTASHMAFNLSRSGQAESIEVKLPTDTRSMQYAGIGGSTTTGYLTSLYADGIYYNDYDLNADGLLASGDGVPGTRGESELDIALLHMPQPIGQVTGTMRLDDVATGGTAYVTGYPNAYGWRQMTDQGIVTKDPVDDVLNTSKLDIAPGDSGGPIWSYKNGAATVSGIVSTVGAAVAVAPWVPWIRQQVQAEASRNAQPSAIYLSASGRNDQLTGGAGNDVLEGNAGTDAVYGAGGNDYLAGGAGDNALDGGDGDDAAGFAGARGQYAFSQDGGAVVVIGPDSRDRLTRIEQVRFAGGPGQSLTDVLASEPAPVVGVRDGATGQERTASMNAVGAGSPDYLRWEYLHSGSGAALASATPNVFIRGGAGDDAIQVTQGSNVLDGNTGSNFLIGSAGTDGGTDTFFTDARGGTVVWNTVVNFHKGDAATLWGFVPGVSAWGWDGISGADGYTGATLRADTRGTGVKDASITFAGLSMEQAQGLAVASGGVGGQPYLYVSNPGV